MILLQYCFTKIFNTSSKSTGQSRSGHTHSCTVVTVLVSNNNWTTCQRQAAAAEVGSNTRHHKMDLSSVGREVMQQYNSLGQKSLISHTSSSRLAVVTEIARHQVQVSGSSPLTTLVKTDLSRKMVQTTFPEQC